MGFWGIQVSGFKETRGQMKEHCRINLSVCICSCGTSSDWWSYVVYSTLCSDTMHFTTGSMQETNVSETPRSTGFHPEFVNDWEELLDGTLSFSCTHFHQYCWIYDCPVLNRVCAQLLRRVSCTAGAGDCVRNCTFPSAKAQACQVWLNTSVFFDAQPLRWVH